MDIGAIKPAERKLNLKHPGNGEALGLTLCIICTQDERVKRVRRMQLDASIDRKGRRSVADVELDNIDLLAATVVGIEYADGVTWEGKTPARSDALVKDMLSRDWLRLQVDEFAGATKDFFTA